MIELCVSYDTNYSSPRHQVNSRYHRSDDRTYARDNALFQLRGVFFSIPSKEPINAIISDRSIIAFLENVKQRKELQDL